MAVDIRGKRWKTVDVETLNQLRQAIQHDGRTLLDIARAAGVDASVLSRMMRSERGITVDSLDLLAKALGLEVKLIRRRPGKKGC